MLGMIEFNKIYSNNLVARDKYKIKELFQRIETVLQIEIAKEVEKLENGMSFLASIGSVGPFIGLLGTVWGIVNAFQSIAISNNTSLAVVAPGIAEALFATALGLLAAIPAVAAYNKFSNDLDKITSNLEYFSIEFLSKKLNEMEKKHNV
jgi:biopolymer transport protein TolQ